MGQHAIWGSGVFSKNIPSQISLPTLTLQSTHLWDVGEGAVVVDFGQFRLRPIFFFEFGQFDFGQFRLRPISISANFDFGQIRLRPISTSANFVWPL